MKPAAPAPPASAAGPGSRTDWPSRRGVSAAQRARILAGIIRVVAERGVHDTTVEQVIGTAGVSRRTFYDLFADRDACLLAAIHQTARLAGERAAGAWATQGRWIDRVRAGLWALLEFFSEDPGLAELCVVDSHQAGPAALARRRQVCELLARRLDEGRAVARRRPPPLTAEGAVGGALEIVHARLLEHPARPLTALFNDLMAFIVLPYLGPRAARDELARASPPRSVPPSAPAVALEELPIRLTYRTMRVLAALAAEPGLMNSKVSERAGISDEGQASKLLGRLARVGLIENIGAPARRNAAKAWRLTPAGERLERWTRRELA